MGRGLLLTIKERWKLSEKGKLKDQSIFYIPVCQLTLTGKYIKTHKALSLAEKATGVQSQDIGKVCKGKRNMAGGYKWMYEKDYILL